MRQLFYRTLPFVFIAIALAACGTPQVTGVVSVEIPGGDREMSLNATMVLGAMVTAGSGTSTAVTWESNDTSVAAIDSDGVLTAVSAGTSTVSATSTADPTKSDSIVVTVVVDADAPTSFDATYVPISPADPPVLGAALVVADPDVLLTPAAFTEVQAGVYLGPVAPIGQDGSVSVVLPAPADVPEAALDVVTSFFPMLETALDCELVASAPETLATPMIFQILTVPGVFLTTFDSGFLPGLLTDSATNPLTIPEEDLDSISLYSFVYATGPTTLTSSGTDCIVDGIVSPFTFDLDLREGWNQISIMIEYDALNAPELISITNGEAQELYVHPLGAF